LGPAREGDEVNLRLGATPFKGSWSPDVDAWLLPALAACALLVVMGPRLAARLAWRRLLWVAVVASAFWSVSLAVAGGGPHVIAAPLDTKWDYLAAVPVVESSGGFVDSFVERVPDLPLHASSHPPGTVLLFWALDELGLEGPGWAAAVVLAVAASATGAVLIALRELGGEETARRAAPFLVLTPAALWIATSADALFMGVGAWAVTLVIVATGRDARPSWAFAAGGGLLAGATLMLSYGLVLLAVVPVAVIVARRRWDVAAVAGTGALVVLGAFAVAGFSWLAGLRAARQEYAAGVASARPYGWFLLVNLLAAAAAIGPAAAAGLRRLSVDGRSVCQSTWLLLPAGALAAVLVADVSGLSKGEVERIWLPFFPWIAAAAAALPWPKMRPWLSASGGTGLALQAFLRSPW